MVGELCSQPPLGVAERRFPKRSATSRWTVSPRVGSPAPSALSDDSSLSRVALEAHGGLALASVDLTGRVAFLLGAEREGLPAAVKRDVNATIPIAGAESLNVAASGAVALYEWRRQNPQAAI